jgi:hypothetical protein
MNAKQEVLNMLGKRKIKCAFITCEDEYINNYVVMKKLYLRVNHSIEEYIEFLSKLDFDYDNGYGGQELYGTIWLDNNQWATRAEYDGSEWWDINVLPEIPKELL